MQTRTGVVAAIAAAAVVGGGAGAGIYAAATPSSTKTTIVRQVAAPVSSAQPAADSTGLTVGQIYTAAHKGVVEITVSTTQNDAFGGAQSSQALGTGFVYDAAGHIVTNDHVVQGANSISVRFWNGAAYKATLVGTDPSSDLAVIRVSAPASVLHPLTVGDSSALQVGDNVVAIGSPFGLAETVTSGIVSALHRQMTAPNNFTINDSIQTDAAINHGNSGGPLLNAQGQVIGVNSQIESDSGGSDGVGFAIPSKTVRSIAVQLISGGKAEHAYLGVSIDAGTGGVKVGLVRPGTPAQAAGLKAGDLITSIDGTSIRSVTALQDTIDARKPGDTISVTYTRNGTSHTTRVKLANRPA